MALSPKWRPRARSSGFDPSWLRKLTPASKSPSLSIIGVRGDSMEPTLSDGDDVLVDLATTRRGCATQDLCPADGRYARGEARRDRHRAWGFGGERQSRCRPGTGSIAGPVNIVGQIALVPGASWIRRMTRTLAAAVVRRQNRPTPAMRSVRRRPDWPGLRRARWMAPDNPALPGCEPTMRSWTHDSATIGGRRADHDDVNPPRPACTRYG